MILDTSLSDEEKRRDSGWVENINISRNPVDIGQSRESKILTEWAYKVLIHHTDPVTSGETNLKEYFGFLVSKWKKETNHYSSISQITKHPAYKEILGLGENAIPLILAEIKREPCHLFNALTFLTGANPVRLDQRGKVKEMVKAWSDWGQYQGYNF